MRLDSAAASVSGGRYRHRKLGKSEKRVPLMKQAELRRPNALRLSARYIRQSLGLALPRPSISVGETEGGP